MDGGWGGEGKGGGHRGSDAVCSWYCREVPFRGISTNTGGRSNYRLEGSFGTILTDPRWTRRLRVPFTPFRKGSNMDHIIKLFRAFAATTIVTALVLVAAPAQAQHCGACDNIVENEEITGHWAVDWWNASGPADEPNDYHDSIEDGSCRAHHDWCESGQMQLATAVLDAVVREDVEYLSGLVTVSSAMIVESRQAIQVPGCDGEIIVGHVPIEAALMASLRLAVAELADGQ